MRDVGPDIGRSRATALARQAGKIGFLEEWCEQNQENFIEVMNLIKDGAPVKYAELYLKAVQMGIVRETNVNIRVDRQQDYDNLQALVRTRVTPTLPTSGAYTPYEEIKQPEYVSKEVGEL